MSLRVQSWLRSGTRVLAIAGITFCATGALLLVVASFGVVLIIGRATLGLALLLLVVRLVLALSTNVVEGAFPAEHVARPIDVLPTETIIAQLEEWEGRPAAVLFCAALSFAAGVAAALS